MLIHHSNNISLLSSSTSLIHHLYGTYCCEQSSLSCLQTNNSQSIFAYKYLECFIFCSQYFIRTSNNKNKMHFIISNSADDKSAHQQQRLYVLQTPLLHYKFLILKGMHKRKKERKHIHFLLCTYYQILNQNPSINFQMVISSCQKKKLKKTKRKV